MRKRTEYTRALGNFSGIDVTSDDSAVDVMRMPYLVNMWRDWDSENGAAIETVPGFRMIPWKLAVSGNKTIHGMWAAKRVIGATTEDIIIIHKGDTLFAMPTGLRNKAENAQKIGIVGDGESTGFSFGDSFYLLTGGKFWKASFQSDTEEGWHLAQLGDIKGEASLPLTSSYIPITYSDGKEYEQRNMLTNYFYNAYTLNKREEANHYNGLLLEVESESYKTLRVVGVHYGVTHIYVPSSVVWNGEPYKIKTIKQGAFNTNDEIRSFVAASGVENVLGGAFYKCKNLETVILYGVKTIEAQAFRSCEGLARVMIGKTAQTIGRTAFYECNETVGFYFQGTQAQWAATGAEIPSSDRITYDVRMIETSVGDTFRVPIDTSVFTKYSVLKGYVSDAVEYIGTYSTGEETGAEFKALSRASWVAIAFSNANGAIKLSVVTIEDKGTAVSDQESKINSYRYDILDPCQSVVEVKIGSTVILPEGEGQAIPSYNLIGETLNEKLYIRAVVVTMSSDDFVGQKLSIKGLAYDSEFSRSAAGCDYTYENAGYKGTSISAICSCTIAAEYDGRIFLTGNPKLPNTVFYSHRNLQGVNDPTYFGQLNYFNDGTGMIPNKSLLSTPSYLAVIKADAMGGGAIYYHTPSMTEYDITPKIYPGVQGTAGVGSLGPCVNFRDDPVFLSAMGLEGISLSAVNNERGIYHRSSNIDKWLLSHDLSKAKLCEWKGYLVILIDGEIFLADSRQMAKQAGSLQYEWYYLDDIGEYVNQKDQFYYPSASPRDRRGKKYTELYFNGKLLRVKEKEMLYPVEYGVPSVAYPTDDAEGKIYSDEGKPYIHYAEGHDENGDVQYYILDSYGEKVEGTFSAASAICTSDRVLYFGTESGNLFCFNTDKRGEAYTDGDYTEPVPPDQIHRSWYNRNGRRYLSGFSTKKDNCGVPHYDKDTCRRSLVLKSKTIIGSRFTLKVRTDREPWEEVDVPTQTEATSFDYDFANASFVTSEEMISPARESKRRWVEKQYYLYSDGWCRPFGIYHLAYRYKISGLAGRIRR